MPPEQSYATHRAWYAPFHFVVLPLVAINVIVHIVQCFVYPRVWQTWWGLAMAIALALLVWCVRYFATRLQDRLIRTEELLRLERVLPPELRARTGELTTSNLIALRFCADEELPELTRAVLAGEVRKREDIKRRIRQWRPDLYRV
jgi:C4-dicarboxylate-specific signal transduction histidine kinase